MPSTDTCTQTHTCMDTHTHTTHVRLAHQRRRGQNQARGTWLKELRAASPSVMERAHCNTLQYTATHCNTLQHTTTHHDVLPFSLLIPSRDRYKEKRKEIPVQTHVKRIFLSIIHKYCSIRCFGHNGNEIQAFYVSDMIKSDLCAWVCVCVCVCACECVCVCVCARACASEGFPTARERHEVSQSNVLFRCVPWLQRVGTMWFVQLTLQTVRILCRD